MLKSFVLETAPCPVCGSSGTRAFEKRGYPIYRCRACGHRYALPVGPDHVAQTYSDAYFHGEAGGYAGYDRDAEPLFRRGRWYAERLAMLHAPGRLLDVGAASGHILEGFLASGWSGYGIEPNQTLARKARERGVDVRQATLETATLEGSFDAVSFVQVLPHFVDLRRALRNAADATLPGGIWLVETWDRTSLVARVLGQRWHEYNPPSVLHWFAHRSLRTLIAGYGFTYVAGGRPPKGISGAHARSLLGADTATPLGRVIGLGARAIPEKLYVPYPGDDVYWAAFRKKAR